jgi:hypothetical protein
MPNMYGAQIMDKAKLDFYLMLLGVRRRPVRPRSDGGPFDGLAADHVRLTCLPGFVAGKILTAIDTSDLKRS